MKISNQKLTGEYILKTDSKSDCLNCTGCAMLKIFEMGLYPETKIKLSKHDLGMWILKILNPNNFWDSKIALREDEMKKIMSDENCSIFLEQIS